jgi:hypothetical protein
MTRYSLPSNRTDYSGFTRTLQYGTFSRSRIPKMLYVQGNKGPLPGKLFASMVLMTDAYNDGKCYDTSTATFTFRKYRSLME